MPKKNYNIDILHTININNMSSLIFKVSDKITKELDLIREEEGLGNRTSTFTFLVKYYFLTRKNRLGGAIAEFNRLAEKIDWDNLPSLEEQLKDV